MTIKTILTEPNKLLRQKSDEVKNVGESEKELIKDMFDSMYAAKGIGSKKNYCYGYKQRRK